MLNFRDFNVKNLDKNGVLSAMQILLLQITTFVCYWIQ